MENWNKQKKTKSQGTDVYGRDEVRQRCKKTKKAENNITFNEEWVGGRARMTADKDLVLHGVWREIKLHR